MNLTYLKYAIKVAECGSINKAAEKLYIDQPNLSRCIKELEGSLGATIFERSSKGMKLTSEGEVFLSYARSVLAQVDALEQLFSKEKTTKKKFSASVPRASYISEAFARFSERLTKCEELEVFYKETNSMRTIKNLAEKDYNLGIVRYAENFDRYYKEMLEEKGFSYELITEFSYVLLVSKDSELAGKENITFADLEGKTEIAHGDPYVPSLTYAQVKKEELPDSKRRIFVFERGSQFDLLSKNPDTYMWVSPAPKDLLERYGLCEKICAENKKLYKDVMIYKNNYKLTELDKAFVSELCLVKREIFK